MLRCVMNVFTRILRRSMAGFDAKCEKGKTPISGVKEYKDITYNEGVGDDGLLDVYVAEETQRGAPVLFDIHGGGLVYGYKELNKRFCYALARHGFVVVSVNYRLVPKTDFIGQLSDITKAMRWTEANIRDYGGGGDYYVCGDSAGALLGLYASAISSCEKLSDAFGITGGFAPRGFLFISGLYDLRAKNYIKHLCKYALPKGYKKTAWYKYTDVHELLKVYEIPPSFLTSSDGDMLKGQTDVFAALLSALGRSFVLDFRKSKRNEEGHEYYHIYPVKNPEWRECRALFDRAEEFLLKTSPNV